MGKKRLKIGRAERKERAWTAQGSKEDRGSALFHPLILSGSCAVNILYLCQ